MVQTGALLELDQRCAKFRGLVLDVSEDPVEVAIGLDQLGRRLLADARDAGEVVTAVAAQCRILRILSRGDTRLLKDPRLVVQRVLAHAALVVEHAHEGIADELVAVAVPRDDDDLVAQLFALPGDRADDVVGLEPDEVDRRHIERLQHLTDESHLLAEDVRRRLTLRLVLRVRKVAERRLRPIERNQHAVWLVLLHQVDEHRGESEHCVGDLAAGGGHVRRQCEERSIGE